MSSWARSSLSPGAAPVHQKVVVACIHTVFTPTVPTLIRAGAPDQASGGGRAWGQYRDQIGAGPRYQARAGGLKGANNGPAPSRRETGTYVDRFGQVEPVDTSSGRQGPEPIEPDPARRWPNLRTRNQPQVWARTEILD